MYLSILIPTLPKRKDLCKQLCIELTRQIIEFGLDPDNEVEIVLDPHEPPITIGQKRNGLLSVAKGDYVCFFDDDDFPAENYIEKIMQGIHKDVDCISLRGIMTTNGKHPELFEHSLKYSSWKTHDLVVEGKVKHERNPNHLNAIRASIAKRFAFPEKNHGEDHAWSKQLHASGLLKEEYYVDEIIYHYQYSTKK